MTKEELEIIFKQKKQKIEKKINKKGITKEKLIAGFNMATFEQFCNWYKPEVYALGCAYCGTTNEISEALYKMQKNGTRPDATRGGKRGKRLELDRVDPNKQYDELENIVWCCYWCNNAKTNFFTRQEFTPIAIEIGKSIKKIMDSY